MDKYGLRDKIRCVTLLHTLLFAQDNEYVWRWLEAEETEMTDGQCIDFVTT